MCGAMTAQSGAGGGPRRRPVAAAACWLLLHPAAAASRRSPLCPAEAGGGAAASTDTEEWLGDDEAALRLIAGVGFRPDECMIDVVEAADLDAAGFEARFRGQKPLLLRGAARAWPARRLWTRSALRAAHGGTAVCDAHGVDTAQFGPKHGWAVIRDRSTTLAAFTDRIRAGDPAALSFDRSSASMAVALKDDWWAPPQLGGLRAEGAVFSLGGAGGGLPMHTHGEAWLGAVHGRKLWAVLGPNGFADPDAYWALAARPLADVLRNVSAWSRLAPSARPALCVQEAGDVLYLPALWWHATMNLGECVAAGNQGELGGTAELMALSARHPSSGRLHMSFGSYAARAGDMARAARHFTAAEDLEPGNWHYRVVRAKALGAVAAELRRAALDLLDAEERGRTARGDAADALSAFAAAAYEAAEHALCLQLAGLALRRSEAVWQALNYGTACALLAGSKRDAERFIAQLSRGAEGAELAELAALSEWLAQQPADAEGLAAAARARGFTQRRAEG
eukprot:TRINITY_DN34056_c0_g1_i1.p1 TRINITY_DN34056_c0_g1~~TRINITY_DN34056_c0_g1_i1.p1  ORF type:complete len:510 (+),score=134.97 TRINITY_DN34056_c0_g1_i1:66-1595(+)